MKNFTLVIFFLLFVSGLSAQDITGSWYGTLNTNGQKLRIVYHLTKTGDEYEATMDSPDQGANGLPTDKTTFINSNLNIEAASIGITYTASFQPDSNKFKGTFKQAAVSIPLDLSRTAPVSSVKAPVKRPQDPKDFPYKQEEVVFNNLKAKVQLAGTLTTPSSGKFSKIIIFISGSGAQNRNEELGPFNQRPFLVWSDWLTRNGFATLRYDDRGTGKSTGVFSEATTVDFSEDAEAAVKYIASRKDLQKLSIGLLGHSEGGIIAPMIADRNPSIKFLILLAAPGIPISDLMLQQNAAIAKLSGASPEKVELANVINKTFYSTIKTNQGLSTPQLKQTLDSNLRKELKAYAKDLTEEVNADAIVNNVSSLIGSRWLTTFVALNPAVYLSKIKCPVIALNGTLDVQVNSTANLAGIKMNLEKAGNKQFEIVPLTGLNHLLQKATTGGVQEYGEIEETVNPVALQRVSNWLSALKN
jgi:pimeloyl-ACP methyl ester carboxylesterase